MTVPWIEFDVDDDHVTVFKDGDWHPVAIENLDDFLNEGDELKELP